MKLQWFRYFPLLLLLSNLSSASLQPYKVDKNHSTIGFSITIMNGLSRVTGKFTDFNVNLQYDDKAPADSSVTATIKTASINTGIAARDNDLKSPLFFDAEKYPEITFASKRVESRATGIVVVGDFSMHGVTKEIALPISLSGTYTDNLGIIRGFSATMHLNRRDYGIIWKHNALPDYIGDDVTVEINLIASVKDSKPSPQPK